MSDASALVAGGAFGIYNALVAAPSSVAMYAPPHAAACRPFVIQSDLISLGIGAIASATGRSWGPFLASLTVVVYMHVLYERAIAQAVNTAGINS